MYITGMSMTLGCLSLIPPFSPWIKVISNGITSIVSFLTYNSLLVKSFFVCVKGKHNKEDGALGEPKKRKGDGSLREATPFATKLVAQCHKE